MCCNVALQLGFTDSDAPVFCRTYKVPLTPLIQLLNQSEKADGGFQLFFFLSTLLLLLSFVFHLDILVSLIIQCCNY